MAGILATSRAMGDYPLKDKKLVIADPDILTFDLNDHKLATKQISLCKRLEVICCLFFSTDRISWCWPPTACGTPSRTRKRLHLLGAVCMNHTLVPRASHCSHTFVDRSTIYRCLSSSSKTANINLDPTSPNNSV